jgi:hypothetical protein
MSVVIDMFGLGFGYTLRLCKFEGIDSMLRLMNVKYDSPPSLYTPLSRLPSPEKTGTWPRIKQQVIINVFNRWG